MRHGLAILFSLLDTFREKIFDLSVHGTEIILCPRGDRSVKLRRKTQGNLFLFHETPSLIETARIDDGLGVAVAAEHDQEV